MDQTTPESLSPSGSHRRRKISSDHDSPEFEFLRVTNPSSSISSADELFHNGIILPLHFLSFDTNPESDPPVSDPDPIPGPEVAPEMTSNRWSSYFRKSDNKLPAKKRKEKDNTRKDRKAGLVSRSELNINIWPFSRSRSAGNSVTRPRISFQPPTSRKVSSAPCSRSNSAGESKSRKWPVSPGGGGMHLGRSSPVWQVRRGSKPAGRVGERMVGNREITYVMRGKMVNDNSKPKVQIHTGYRSRLSCRNKIGSGNSLFSFRNFFVKKVY